MIEANTAYLWQMPGGVVANEFLASVPGFKSANSKHTIHADTGIAISESAFFHFGKHVIAASFSLS